jgi:hypothetical protein
VYGIPTLELEPKTKTKRMGIANTSSTVLGILQLVIRKKRSSAVRNVVTVTLSYFPSLKYHIKTHVDVVTWRVLGYVFQDVPLQRVNDTNDLGPSGETLETAEMSHYHFLWQL